MNIKSTTRIAKLLGVSLISALIVSTALVHAQTASAQGVPSDLRYQYVCHLGTGDGEKPYRLVQGVKPLYRLKVGSDTFLCFDKDCESDYQKLGEFAPDKLLSAYFFGQERSGKVVLISHALRYDSEDGHRLSSDLYGGIKIEPNDDYISERMSIQSAPIAEGINCSWNLVQNGGVKRTSARKARAHRRA